jgi:enoyl-[acyl-carrier protein] reductase I
VTIEEIGNTALYLLSDLGSGVTGETHHVDSGYNIMAMPRLEELKAAEAREENEPEAAE